MTKIKNESIELANHISFFVYSYAESQLTESKHTIKNYRIALESYLDYLSECCGVKPATLSIKDFEANTIRGWITWLKGKGNSNATCDVRLSSLRTFLKYLEEKNIKYLHLYTQAREIKRKNKTKPDIKGISREGIKALLAVPDQSTPTGRRDIVFMTVMYCTACRLDELLSLQLKNIHLDSKNPYVTFIGKGKKVRTVPLLPKASAHLEKYIETVFGQHKDPEAYLFYSRVKGTHSKMSATAAEKLITKNALIARRSCNEIPENFHPHQLRHSKATHWLEDGMNIVQISTLLGHSNLETTMIYLGVSTEAKREAMATLEDEKTATTEKKWRNKDGSLKSFCLGR